VGLAFCVGLSGEAGVVEKLLKANGFEVVSVVRKAGRTSESKIGNTDGEKHIRARMNPLVTLSIRPNGSIRRRWS
jgi:uncharacterized metal-binding protein